MATLQESEKLLQNQLKDSSDSGVRQSNRVLSAGDSAPAGCSMAG
jgi:hypothetical protein